MKLPHSKRKFVPVSSHLTDASAKVVLSERNIEIKDLESKVKFLKNKIIELENENKTLRSIQSLQGRELKKFKEGATDIPSLLKSHKEETKVYESTISTIRKELRECQKELKLRNENLLKKENMIDKLNVNIKQNEKIIHEFSSEVQVLKAAKTDLEDENKTLVMANENLKNENEDLCRQIKELTLKTQNVEEDLCGKSDLNENLKNQLSELKEKYEKELSRISSDKKLESCEKQVLCDDISSTSKAFAKNSCVNFVENEIENQANSVIDDEQNLWSIKPVDKTKAVLIDTFKSFKNFHNLQEKNSMSKLFEVGMSNIKLLPPLKTLSEESPTSIMSDFGKRECSSASADLSFSSRIKFSPHDVSAKEFQKKCAAADYRTDKSENKACLSCDSEIKREGDFLNFLFDDDSKDWENSEFRKKIQCIKDTDEIKRFENSLHTSEIKNCERSSRPSRIRDYLLNKNLKENAECSLERNNATDKKLEEGKQNCFIESSEIESKSWGSTMSGKKYECKSNKYKADNPIHRSIFVKQPINSKKPVTFFHFDEISEHKSSESQSDLSWWDK